jgi:Polyketide cyclase / dehydrase and lipid transport
MTEKRSKRRRRHIVYIAVVALAVIVASLLVLTVRGVRLSSETVVSLTTEQTWAFFSDPHNLAQWDRSVARVEPTSTAPVGVGYTFDTIGPERAGRAERSSYRISEFTPKRGARADLVNSDKFQRAYWWTRLEPTAGGTRIVIDVEFAPKLQYFFLTPVLFLSRNNLLTDMKYLHDEVEAYGRRHRP